MKTFKTFRPLVMALSMMVCLGFFSCSDDDDDDNIVRTSNLIGIWEYTHSKGWKIENGEKNKWDKAIVDPEDIVRIEFCADNNFCVYEFLTEEKKWITFNEGYYRKTGNQITLSDDENNDGDDNTETYTIKKLSSSQLILEISAYYNDGQNMESCLIENTYKKIK